MSALPPAMNFAAQEEEICKKWKEEDSFHQQDKLSLERGDAVGAVEFCSTIWRVSFLTTS